MSHEAENREALVLSRVMFFQRRRRAFGCILVLGGVLGLVSAGGLWHVKNKMRAMYAASPRAAEAGASRPAGEPSGGRPKLDAGEKNEVSRVFTLKLGFVLGAQAGFMGLLGAALLVKGLPALVGPANAETRLLLDYARRLGKLPAEGAASRGFPAEPKPIETNQTGRGETP